MPLEPARFVSSKLLKNLTTIGEPGTTKTILNCKRYKYVERFDRLAPVTKYNKLNSLSWNPYRRRAYVDRTNNWLGTKACVCAYRMHRIWAIMFIRLIKYGMQHIQTYKVTSADGNHIKGNQLVVCSNVGKCSAMMGKRGVIRAATTNRISAFHQFFLNRRTLLECACVCLWDNGRERDRATGIWMNMTWWEWIILAVWLNWTLLTPHPHCFQANREIKKFHANTFISASEKFN